MCDVSETFPNYVLLRRCYRPSYATTEHWVLSVGQSGWKKTQSMQTHFLNRYLKVSVLRGSWPAYKCVWSQFGPILSLGNGRVPLSSSKAITPNLSKVTTAHVLITARSGSYQIYAKTHALLLKHLHGSRGLSVIKHVECHSSTFYLCMDNRLMDKCTLEFSKRKLTFMPLSGSSTCCMQRHFSMCLYNATTQSN